MLRILPIFLLVLCGACRLFDGPTEVTTEDTEDDVAYDAGDVPTVDVRDDPTVDAAPDLAEDTAPDSPPDDWWDLAFPNRVSMTFDSTATDHTVRVAFRSGSFDLQSIESKSLRFLQADALLPIDIERDDEEVIAVWVRVPDLAQPVDVYWGNPNAFSAQDADTTWERYNGIFHMDDEPDVTGIFNSAIRQNVEFQPGAVGYDAVMTNGFLSYPSEPEFDATVEDPVLLMEAYVLIDDLTADEYVLYKEGSCVGWSLEAEATRWRAGLGMAPTGCVDNYYANLSGGLPPLSTWVYVAVHLDIGADTLTLYGDGVMLGQVALGYDGTSLTTRNARVSFGTDWQRIDGIDGRYDEVRFSRITPTTEYFDTQLSSFRDQLIEFTEIETLPTQL